MKYDTVIDAIATYVVEKQSFSKEAYETAQLCFADALACGFLALKDPECKKHLGPFFPGTTVQPAVRVPGTSYLLDPLQAAYNIGVMNRWLDYNDTWLAAEWGHPSDNLAAILASADYASHQRTVTLDEVFNALIKAYEIQGVLSLKNSLNAQGFDHVLFVKVACTALAAQFFGCDKEAISAAISNAFIDVGSLRTYRHAPNTGHRKSWAAGDAASRAVFLAWQASKGEKGYASALTAPKWGFQDSILGGKELVLERPLGCYVMENILFKVWFPAEFHAQTAVEAAIQLHPKLKGRINDIQKIEIDTHSSAIRIITKSGPLHNFADRDHCIQYMAAVGLLFGELHAENYSDEFARKHPEIDALREKMIVKENPQYSVDYLDPNKRSIANSLKVTLKDGQVIGPVTVEYPLGHRRRRSEGLTYLREKLDRGLSAIGAIKFKDIFPPPGDMPLDLFLQKFTKQNR